MLHAMHQEIGIQAHYLVGQSVETLYFGGGTPSLLAADDIQYLIDLVAEHFHVHPNAEITIEANPDDLDITKVNALKNTSINRFSIGIQSFFEEDLRWMNRAHNAEEAQHAIQRVQDAGYGNITSDLIYGYPLLSADKWQYNIDKLLELEIPHISAYSMTVEPHTALAAFIHMGKQPPMDEAASVTQFEYLMDMLATAGYTHYEISNFAKPGNYARHNSNYWKGVPYLGIGPSAHSFDGSTRQWNVNNNAKYIKGLHIGKLSYEKETLSEQDKLNEYIMTTLRTIWGLDLDYVKENFGEKNSKMLYASLQSFATSGEVFFENQKVMLTRKGKLMADHIAAALFVENEAVNCSSYHWQPSDLR